MKALLSLTLLASYALTLSSQTEPDIAKDTLYFDEDWQPATKANYHFYRPLPLKTKGDLALVKDYYRNGTLQMEGYAYMPDLETYNGEVTWYFDDGFLQEKSFYEHGKLLQFIGYHYSTQNPETIRIYEKNTDNIAILKIFHENGELYSYDNYINNKLDGECFRFYDNGVLWIHKYYNGGEASGPHIHYHEDGSFDGIIAYNNGKRQGTSVFYHPNGAVRKEADYTKGYDNRRVKLYFETGVPKEERWYANGALEKEVAYFENGNLYEERQYQNRKAHGTWLTYYESGNVKLKKDYFNGELTGEREEYFSNGELMYRSFFDNAKILQAEAYFSSMQLSKHHKCLKKGKSRHCKLSKRLSEKMSFKNGKRHGKFLEYFNNGLLKSIEHFRMGHYAKTRKEYNILNPRFSDSVLKAHKEKRHYLVLKIKYNPKRHTKTTTYYIGNSSISDTCKENIETKTSKCKTYHDNGKLYSKGRYKNNEKTGIWKYYTTNGKLLKTETH